MAIQQGGPTHLSTTNIADLLERVLDKGVVIAGDVKLKLLDIELLTIQLRLVVCSVDKAQQMGIDWWSQTKSLCAPEETPPIEAGTEAETKPALPSPEEHEALQQRVEELQQQLEQIQTEQQTPWRRPKTP
ncbi:MAG: gas vesicle protein [Planctomycetota bacterium]